MCLNFQFKNNNLLVFTMIWMQKLKLSATWTLNTVLNTLHSHMHSMNHFKSIFNEYWSKIVLKQEKTIKQFKQWNAFPIKIIRICYQFSVECCSSKKLVRAVYQTIDFNFVHCIDFFLLVFSILSFLVDLWSNIRFFFQIPHSKCNYIE